MDRMKYLGDSSIAVEWLSSSVEHFHAYADLEYVFQGTYVDDVVSALYRIRKPRRVLVLGASLAAVLLPLSVFPVVEEVTLVDLNLVESKIIEKFSSSMRICLITSDAKWHLIATEETYDLIYCDLFTADGYAECMFDAELYAAAQRRLSADGAILINAFDVSSYLSPETGETVTSAISTQLSAVLPVVEILKHRRNCLIFGRRESTSSIYQHLARPLFGLDCARLEISKVRALEFIHAPNLLSTNASRKSALYSEIDLMLARRMTAFMCACAEPLGIGAWNSLHDFAMRADFSTQRIRAAFLASQTLHHIVLMELAANSFSDSEGSVNRLIDISNALGLNLVVDMNLLSQGLVDLHTILLNGRTHTDQLLAIS